MIIADACDIWGQGVGSHAIVLLWLWMNVLMIIFEFLFHVSCYHNKGVLAPYGCHPSESTRSRGHGWRLPSSSMNYRYSMPFRQNFDDAIPAANRGPSFWRPRRTEITRLWRLPYFCLSTSLFWYFSTISIVDFTRWMLDMTHSLAWALSLFMRGSFFSPSFCTGKKVSLESWQNLRRVWLWYARSVYN